MITQLYATVHLMKQISSLITQISQQLLTAYKDPILCEQYAWWIIEAVTGKKQAYLIGESGELTPEQSEQITAWLARLIDDHMPIQYLIGTVPFNDVDILVEPPILIPRPETEEWCFNLIEQLKQLPHTTITILDMCSGSGCIALALAKSLPQAKVYACDINPQAIALSLRNVRHNQLSNVTFFESDLFNAVPRDLRFDLIVSNPPYIPPSAWHSLSASVTQWEDKRALIAEHNGLAIIEQIITHAPHYLRHNHEMQELTIPQLVLEIDYTQGASVQKLMQTAHYNHVAIKKDLEGNDRIAIGRVDYVATAARTP